MTRTNAYSLTCVLIRTCALWLFANTVLNLPELFSTVRYWADLKDQLTSLGAVYSGVLIAVAVILWIFADTIARIALARPDQTVFESDIDPSEWQSIAFSIVGLWQAIVGVVYLTHRIYLAIYQQLVLSSPGEVLPPLDQSNIGWFVAECVRLVIGLALLFGARGLVGLIRRYRQVGLGPVRAQEPSESGAEDSAESSLPPQA